MDGDEGTADMATWLLWAELEKGLDYTWRIHDRTQPTVGEKYSRKKRRPPGGVLLITM
jgi:hypothetical protein